MSGWGLEPVPGGWSGRTWRGGGPGGYTLVRLFPPDLPLHGPEVEAAVLTLVRGLVPVPEVLEVRRAVPEADQPGLLVTEWVDGASCAEDAWPRWDAQQRSRFGAQMGEWAAVLAGIPFLRAGEFVDADLTVRPWPAYGAGLEEWVAQHRSHLVDWEEGEVRALARVAARAQAQLDRAGRVSLVHSDLNPKNVLVDARTAEVRAIVDWEFAHAGHPASDLGNLLRFHRDPGYEAAALAAYCARRGGTPEDLLLTARSADLWALVDLASRAGSSEPARRAALLLREVAGSEDVHACPAHW